MRSATPTGAADGDRIVIRNFLYEPEGLRVRAGTEVTVVNEDSAPHTLTEKAHALDSGTLEKGQTFRFTLQDPGRYDYLCDIHQYMKGTITVT